MRTAIYVDGFNLYFGAVKDTPLKWLDIHAMCRMLLPSHEIVRIRYFTAIVSAREPGDQSPVNQNVYLRALRTCPFLSVHLGHFLTHVKKLPLVNPIGDQTFAKVLKTEEKGSDVNLATYLLRDAFRDEYDAAVLVTNDSDLLEPVKVVKQELRKTVGIICPHKHPSKQLLAQATFMKQIRQGVLEACQLPPILTDSKGTIHKPTDW
ncbi:MAG: NYN domain-containing protein [Phycisphaerales bacterium]|nr:NYN domain-containing protein [Phycisphaerales bacterium]